MGSPYSICFWRAPRHVKAPGPQEFCSFRGPGLTTLSQVNMKSVTSQIFIRFVQIRHEFVRVRTQISLAFFLSITILVERIVNIRDV